MECHYLLSTACSEWFDDLMHSGLCRRRDPGALPGAQPRPHPAAARYFLLVQGEHPPFVGNPRLSRAHTAWKVGRPYPQSPDPHAPSTPHTPMRACTVASWPPISAHTQEPPTKPRPAPAVLRCPCCVRGSGPASTSATPKPLAAPAAHTALLRAAPAVCAGVGRLLHQQRPDPPLHGLHLPHPPHQLGRHPVHAAGREDLPGAAQQLTGESAVRSMASGTRGGAARSAGCSTAAYLLPAQQQRAQQG